MLLSFTHLKSKKATKHYYISAKKSCGVQRAAFLPANKLGDNIQTSFCKTRRAILFKLDINIFFRVCFCGKHGPRYLLSLGSN